MSARVLFEALFTKVTSMHRSLCCLFVCLFAGSPVDADERQTDRGRDSAEPQLRILSFNVLQGGGDAGNVGFHDRDFGGSRRDEIADVIRLTRADVVGVQEDAPDDSILKSLGPGWHRVGNVYARFPLEAIEATPYLTACRVRIGETQGIERSVIVLNVHWSPSDYGPFLVQESVLRDGKPADPEAFEAAILKNSDRASGARGYLRTVAAVRKLKALNEPLFVTGDFNEPSHLDWTERAAREGLDRWVANPTSVPLKFTIRWRGSQFLHAEGLEDAYRTVFPDEAAHPGNTWTPPYPNNTPGRRPFDARPVPGMPVPVNQVLDRIDRVYYLGRFATPLSSSVVGENRETSEIVFSRRWPSDHRAVLATFQLLAAE